MGFIDNLKNGWNAFRGREPTEEYPYLGPSYGYDYQYNHRRFQMPGAEKTILTAIYNRIAMDAAGIDIKHVRLDEQGRFFEEMDSGLNKCLTIEANTDQSSRAFIQDAVLSMLDDGVIAIVPVDADTDIRYTKVFDVYEMRVAKIVTWYPQAVRVEIYNERNGKREEKVLPKATVAIVENPLYAVINDRASVAHRLVQKLAALDVVDQETSSGKMNMILQMPFSISTEKQKKKADMRLKAVEDQLQGSKYGVAYVDATEKITQLNRPLENHLLDQIEYLQKMLYSQLGMNEDILNGTANAETMTNYYNRTIEPIVAAIADEMKRKFLTDRMRANGQSIEYFRDPFRLVPASDMAELADKFTRNAIMSSNEIRQIVGLKPSDDPDADVLRNKNLNQSAEEEHAETNKEEKQNGKRV